MIGDSKSLSDILCVRIKLGKFMLILRRSVFLMIVMVLLVATSVNAQESPTPEPLPDTPIPTDIPTVAPIVPATETSTPVPTLTFTLEPSLTPLPTSTPTATETVTELPSLAPTLTASETELATATSSLAITETATGTATTTGTATITLTPTASLSPSPTDTAQVQNEAGQIVSQAGTITCSPSAVTNLISISSNGDLGNSDSGINGLAISDDGRYIVFTSSATNLVTNDTNGKDDVFIFDQQACTTRRMSVNASGLQANDAAGSPAISTDGQTIAFTSLATNMLPGDTNKGIFIRKLLGSPVLARVAGSGAASMLPSISGDGRYVTYTELVDANTRNIILYDTQTSLGTLIETVTNVPTYSKISRDGSVVVYINAASSLSIYNRVTAQITQQTFSIDTSSPFDVSADGRYIVFASSANDLVVNDTNNVGDVFVFDRQLEQISRVSVTTVGLQANGPSSFPAISPNGLFVSYISSAANLVSGDTNNFSDVFVHDIAQHATYLVSSNASGVLTNTNSGSFSAPISGNNQYVAFVSSADNLVTGDNNVKSDVFVVKQLSLNSAYQAALAATSTAISMTMTADRIYPSPTVTTVIGTPTATPIVATPTVTTTPTPSNTPIPTAAGVQTYVVNVTDDNSDGVCDATHCSLREAITAANASPGTDAISFNIPGTAPFTILPLLALPNITDPVIIDGNTQPGFSGTPIISINGSNLLTVDGLTVTGGGSTLRGLNIVLWGGEGIKLVGGGGNIIEGNFIGIDVTGTVAQANGHNGIYISGSPNNRIGGTTAAQRNIISGNTQNSISIDGTTSTGNQIIGNYIGTNAAGTADVGNVGKGISINNAGSNTIGGNTADRRNIISGNDAGALLISGTGTGNLVLGNYFGSDLTGTALIANGSPIIQVLSNSNTIGGTSGSGTTCNGSCNLIVGSDTGLQVSASSNNVQGNFFGLSANGNTPLGSLNTGILMQGGTNTIGGASSATRNIIANYTIAGIQVNGTGTIQSNFIGTDSTGTIDLVSGSGAYGISVSTGGSKIGGVNIANTCAAPCNLISGSSIGIYLFYSNATTIQGNFIGTNVNGTAALGGGYGIALQESNNNIIGSSPFVNGTGNVISGNATDGISMTYATGNIIQGNFIGLAGDKVTALGNGDDGIELGASGSNNTIGKTNTIAFNGDSGIVLNSNTATGNKITSNSIYGNGGLGIDLNPVGVSPNDVGDNDVSANGLQNYPILTTGTSQGSTITVTGTLNSKASHTYTLEFFSSTTCDANGYGEGQTFIGQTSVTTDASGNASFTVNLTGAANKVITATATDSTNNTSEFSACLLALNPPTSLTVSYISTSALKLNWVDNSDNETEYRVERSYNGTSNWIEIAVLPADSSTFTDATIVCGLPFYYRVRTYRSTGAQYSGYTSVVSNMTLCSLNAPTSLAITGTQPTQVSLSWIDNADNETGFSIERSADGVNGWTAVASVGQNTTAFNDNTVICEQNYYYRVQAIHTNGQTSPYSNTINAVTPLCKPTSLTAVLATDTQINLTWADNSSSETTYLIERSINNSPTWTELAPLAANATTYSDSTLICNRSFTYRVRAYRSGDNSYSAYSNTVTQITPKCPPADLSLTKTVSNASPGEAEPFTYTLTLSNAGPNAAPNVTVRDVLASNLLFVSAVGSQGTYDASTQFWTIGDVSANSNITLTITVRTTGGTVGQAISNMAQVWSSDASDPDSTPANGLGSEDDQSSVSVTAVCAPASVFNVAAGDTLGLIAAISAANNETCYPGANTINLAPNSTYELTKVYVNDSNGGSGLPMINTTITIEGNGSTIQRSTTTGTPNFRLVYVSGSSTQPGVGGNLILNGITLKNGLATSGTAAGAILNSYGTVLLNNSTVINSIAVSKGISIYNRGTLTITNSLFKDNIGGISGIGGIITNEGTASITNSTFSNNRTGSSSNSIVFQNSSQTLILTNNTFVDNTTSANNLLDRSNGTFTLRGNLFVNSQPKTCYSGIVSLGYNFSTDASCAGYFTQPTDVNNVNLRMGVLTNNGGYTQTYALYPGNPAIDAIPAVDCTVSTDQTGATRPIDSNGDSTAKCEAGALEMGRSDFTLDKNVDLATANVGDTLNFTIQLTNNGPDNALGVVVADPLSSKVNYVSFSASQGTYDPVTGFWTIGALNVGSTVNLTITTTINVSAASGSIPNEASVIAASTNDLDGAARDSTTTTVGACSPLISFNIPNGDVNALITAIDAANDEICYPGINTINLATNGSYVLTTIHPDASGESNGLPIITSNIVIEGHGATIQRDSSAPAFRIFTVTNSGHLTLNSTSVKNSSAVNGGAVANAGTLDLNTATLSGNSASGQGGAVYNTGTLTATGSTFTSNTSGSGGAISSQGSLSLSSSTISKNTAVGSTAWGGGLYISAGTATVTSTTFSNNSLTVNGAQGAGGAIANFASLTLNSSNILNNKTIGANGLGGGLFIFNTGSATVSNTTFDSNQSPSGAGIYDDLGTLNVSGSTFSNNGASAKGGGIFASGTLNITNSTFSSNLATTSGGALEVMAATVQVKFSTFNANTAAMGSAINDQATTTIKASIFANSVGNNCAGVATTSAGYNISDDISCNFHSTGDLNGINPSLGGLANNGGLTKTHALQAGSVVFNSVPLAACSVATDQRGTARPQGTACESGAFEGTGTSNTPRLKINNVNTVADTGDGKLIEGEIVDTSITQFLVTFNQPALNPTGDNGTNDVTNPSNYRLIRDGANGIFQTSCGAVVGDDILVNIDTVAYNSSALTATLSVNGGVELPGDDYRLLACATLQDVNGGALDGDKNGIAGDNFILGFSTDPARYSADLVVTQTDNPDPVLVNGTLTYTVTVANPNGPQKALNVVLTDTIPNGTTFSSAAGCTANNGVVTCNLGTILRGQSKVTTIAVTVDATTIGTLTNTVSATSSVSDPNSVNNTNIKETTSANEAIATNLVVNTTDGGGDGVCGVYHCSLRDALTSANARAGVDTITFNLPGSGPYTIKPTTVLPSITEAVILDGWSQSGYANKPIIEINGSSASSNTNGLVITAGNSTIRGLVINNFDGDGLVINTLGSNTIVGNYIGTNIAGDTAKGNREGIVINGSPNNIIGGVSPKERNVISGNRQNGLTLTGAGATGNTIQGNFVGTNAAGTIGMANSIGMAIGGANTLIGGTSGTTSGGDCTGACNLISYNVRSGITFSGANTRIQGNFIGTDVTGKFALGNGSGPWAGSDPLYGNGISSSGSAVSTSVIGGTTPSARNIISGNVVSGISAAYVKIIGNYIGTDTTGTQNLGNQYYGVDAVDAIVGGSGAGERNVISGNRLAGVYVYTSTGTNTVIQGNYIGTNANGTAALPNGGGISVFTDKVVIGGSGPGQGNLISGNSGGGIGTGDDTIIQGNLIGTDATGTLAIGNGGYGINISGDKAIVGGINSGEGNTIAYNTKSAIYLYKTSTKNNSIRGNAIYANGGLGIDLQAVTTSGDDGVTPNDVGDSDVGGNNLQNFPVLTDVTISSGQAAINGSLNSSANAAFQLDFYANATCDPTGYGEGQIYLGHATQTTDASGNVNFSVTFPMSLSSGTFITSTATDATGNTSEFSACKTAFNPPANLTATTVSGSEIQLNWIDNNTNETAFHIERSLTGTGEWTEIAQVNADVTSYNQAGLTCASTYYYRVRGESTNGDFSAYSNTISIRPCTQRGPVFNVNTTANTDDGVCDITHCTLREAIEAANLNSGAQTINLATNTLYTFAAVDNDTATGPTALPIITGEIVINGNGSIVERSSADGTPLFRIFQVAATGKLTLNDITIRNGNIYGQLPIAWPKGYGGGVANFGGSVTVNRSTIADNRAYFGGGISNMTYGMLVVNSSTLSGNYGGYGAGGIGNDVKDLNEGAGTVTVTNSTISGNSGTQSALFNGRRGTMTLTQSTIANNTNATRAIQNEAGSTGGLYLRANILSDISTVCYSTYGLISQGYNVVSDNSCGLTGTGDTNTVNPMLNTLANNGGLTQTHSLQSTSPAIDHVPAASCTLTTDQRGIARPADGNNDAVADCDSGAYEVAVTTIADLSLTKTVSNAHPNAGGSITYTLTLTNSGPDSASNIIVKDLLPAGVTYTNATASQGAYNNTTGIWSTISLVANSSATLNIQVTVNNGQAGLSIQNTAQVTQSSAVDLDSTPNNNVSTEDDYAKVTAAIACPTTPFTIAAGDTAALIAAIDAANNELCFPGADTITLAAGSMYTFTQVNNSGTGGYNALPLITAEIVINGNGAILERSSANGTPQFRMFHVISDGFLTLNELTLRGGNTDYGGMIRNEGQTFISNSTFIGNRSSIGGAIYNYAWASLTISDSVFSNNQADYGGALYNYQNTAATITITHTTFTGNQGQYDGGAIYNRGRLSIASGSEFSANTNINGGGILYNGKYGVLTLSESTFANNTSGGAIRNEAGTVTVTNATFYGNSTYNSTATAITNLDNGTVTIHNSTLSGNGTSATLIGAYSGTIRLKASILYANPGANCIATSGTLVSEGYNITDDSSCALYLTDPTDRNGVNPGLNALANNGGTTQTQSLQINSLAIDALPSTLCGVSTDQRGLSRPQGDGCDIGSYEAQTFLETPTNLTGTANSPSSISLHWNDTFNETEYQIERSLDGITGWAKVGTVNADATSYIDTSLICNQSYAYRIRAYRSNEALLSSSSNIATITTSACLPADLNISISQAANSVVVSTSQTYTLTIRNLSANAAQNVVITDTLPIGTAYESVTPSGAMNCQNANGIVTCTLNTLAGNGVATVIIKVTLNPATNGSITNSVSVSSLSPDNVPSNNSATITTAISALSQLGTGQYQENGVQLAYTGSWISFSGTGPQGGSYKYTNDPNGKVSFSVNSTVGRIILYRTTYTIYGTTQIFLDGGTTPIATMNNSSPTFLFGVPFTISITPGNHIIELRNVDSNYSSLDQIDLLPPALPLTTSSYQESDPNLLYSGNWLINATTSALGNGRKYTNDANATVSFSINNSVGRVTIYRTTYLAGVYGSMQVFMDGAATPVATINNTSSGFLFQQPFTFVVTPGDHIITLKNVGSTFSDLDQITLQPPAAPLPAGTYQETEPNLTYSGIWTPSVTTSALGNGRSFTNDPNGSVTFSINNTVGRVTIYRTTYLAGVYGSMQVFMDGAATPFTTINNTSSGFLFQQPFTFAVTPGDHMITLKNVGSTYSDIDQITLQAAAPLSAATYQEDNAALSYNGNWLSASAAGALGGTRKYTNDPNASVTLSINNSVGRITIYRTTYLAGVYGSLQVYLDNGTTPVTTINNTSSAFLYGQPFTFAVTPGNHVITLKNVGTTYSDLDQITLQAPPAALSVGNYDETNSNLVYSGNWLSASATGTLGGTRSYTNDPNASVTFSINNSVGRVTIYRTTYLAGVYGALQIYLDGNVTPFMTINNTSSAFLYGQPFTFAVLPGSHTITLKNVGATYSDLDQITLQAPTTPLTTGTYQEDNAGLIYNGNWLSASATGALGGTRKYTNDPNGNVIFTIDSTVGSVTIFRTTYAAGVYGSFQVYVDNNPTPLTSINNTSSTFLYGQPFTFAVTPGNHIITIKNVGSTYSDVDQITLAAS